MNGHAANTARIVEFRMSDAALWREAALIREKVFIVGQQCPVEEEFDAFDVSSNHILLAYEGKYAGTARFRLTPDGVKLERFAVLEEYRGKGLGLALVQHALRCSLELKKPVYMHAQLDVAPLYERVGFVREGPVFDEVGIPHVYMRYAVS